MGQRLAPISSMHQCLGAFILVTASYFALALGAHYVNAQGLMHWSFYIFAVVALPMAELMLIPALFNAAYYLRRASYPTVALAFLPFSQPFSGEGASLMQDWSGHFMEKYLAHNDKLSPLASYENDFFILGVQALIVCLIFALIIAPLCKYAVKIYEQGLPSR
jgi:hypothetical protein